MTTKSRMSDAMMDEMYITEEGDEVGVDRINAGGVRLWINRRPVELNADEVDALRYALRRQVEPR